MITLDELETIAQERLLDADALIAAGRYDGAAYICGYAIELSLKAKICKTLKWSDFPSSSKEFQNYQSFKVHNLDVLLHLSGMEGEIKTNHMADWSNVSAWNPESRYKTNSLTSELEATKATTMLNSVKRLITIL
ncbi:MAG: HEPN domain-containing protein [Methylococcales bacterium]|nr:HEPN domain-containing protein [Methylococcales bacterium]MDP3838409.1 HEPN domain-containing protein [Methylococcales bacterium]